MKKIVLMGCPNVGKSVVFSRLTGVNVISSNYPGTIVDFTKGTTRIGGEKFELVDVPGTYSDTGLHKLGLHGSAIVPTILGFGCNVPGALATRIMETKKQRFIAATLMAIAVPCMAQSAMIFGVLGSYGLKWILMVYCTLFVLYIILGILLKKIVKGESPELLIGM